MNDLPRTGAQFKSLEESTAADWKLIHAYDREFDVGLTDRIFSLLESLGQSGGAMPVTRLEHSLQTATRALRAGEAEAYVIAALVHDLGELYFPHNHAAFGAALMRPYVDDTLHFVLEHHPIFQGYHYWHVMGGDRHARDGWRGHRAFQAAARFCALYDQPSFDAGYDTLALDAFRPIAERVFAKPLPGYDANLLPRWRRAVRRLFRLTRG